MKETTNTLTIPSTDEIRQWGADLGFQQIGITDTNLIHVDDRLQEWLNKDYQGSMDYLAKNREIRRNPSLLVEKTKSIIIGCMNYLPKDSRPLETLSDKNKAYISRYALGRDYHRKIRKQMSKLAKKIAARVDNCKFRSFADSAPVFEKALAEKAGIGWMGKNSLIINRNAGSWFFLGVLYTNFSLPIDEPSSNHCGSCQACMDVCPTKAIVAPYQLNASQCISYLTIENKKSIPEEFRLLMGNRIYGCDDCQIFCPWNKFAKLSQDEDFQPRHHLNDSDLIKLFAWTEAEFLEKTEGSAIRRTGYEGWLRNIAVALGNAPSSPEVISALRARSNHPSLLVREHVHWAIKQHDNNT